MNKRLSKEIRGLYNQKNSKPLIENDYIIHIDDSDVTKVYVLLKCPLDSVYRHKFMIFIFDIPSDYPYSPPVVNFLNRDFARIHPNMYEDGKCCCTILNTWPSNNEKWTSSMSIETVILAFQSFLDNNPYTHEPGGQNDESYTDYVLHQSWYTCLLSYLGFSTGIQVPEPFTEFIKEYITTNIKDIDHYIDELEKEYFEGIYYTRCFEIDNYEVCYPTVRSNLHNRIHYWNLEKSFCFILEEPCEEILNEVTDEILKPPGDDQNKEDSQTDCGICYDTSENSGNLFTTKCGHVFHTDCFLRHVITNGKICSLCRNEDPGDPPPVVIEQQRGTKRKFEEIEEEYITNPLTGRKVLVGGRTYTRLVSAGIILPDFIDI